MSQTLKMIASLSVLAILSACTAQQASDGDQDVSSEHVGTTQSAFSELNCATRTVSAPTNGATFSSVPLSHCVGTQAISPNGSYNYSNCTHGYIVDFLSFVANDSPSAPGNARKLDVAVGPATVPTTKAACEDTVISYYVYGTDATESTWNQASLPSGNPAAKSAKGVWVLGSGGLFPDHCEWDQKEVALTTAINLDKFNNDPTVPPMVSMRVVAQVTNAAGTTWAPVRVSVGAGAYTSPSGCVSFAKSPTE